MAVEQGNLKIVEEDQIKEGSEGT